MSSLTAAEYSKFIQVAEYDKEWGGINLSENYPECPYSENGKVYPKNVAYSGIEMTTLTPTHWGQLKLFASTLSFFNKIKDKSSPITCVYAGAASGHNLVIIATVCPHVTFHLYDPAKFHPGLHNVKNVELNPRVDVTPGLFTDRIAASYSRESVYFISDIRMSTNEEDIERDMRTQEKWVRIMQPQLSMLKFRVPFPRVGASRIYTYTRGVAEFQCFPGVLSAEARLFIKCEDIGHSAEWDTVKYERNMSWRNRRARAYDNGAKSLKELDIADSEVSLRTFWTKLGVSEHVPLGADFVNFLQIMQMRQLPMLYKTVSTIIKELGKIGIMKMLKK